MLCKYVKQKLDRYIQGDLPDSANKKIARHISNCQSCADALCRIRKLAGLFEDTLLPSVPVNFSERLMQLARHRQHLQKEPESTVIKLWEWFDRTGLRKAAVAAVLVMGLSLGLFMGRDTWQSPVMQSGEKSQMVKVETFDIYNLDYLTDIPKGSLSDAYLTLAFETNGRKR